MERTNHLKRSTIRKLEPPFLTTRHITIDEGQALIFLGLESWERHLIHHTMVVAHALTTFLFIIHLLSFICSPVNRYISGMIESRLCSLAYMVWSGIICPVCYAQCASTHTRLALLQCTRMLFDSKSRTRRLDRSITPTQLSHRTKPYIRYNIQSAPERIAYNLSEPDDPDF